MAALLLAAFTLPWLYRRDARRQRQQRAALFAQCLELFQTYRVTQQGADYPTLEGTYRGLRVRLEPILDTVAWRKIPSLWLKVTVFAPNPQAGVLDFLVRPQGAEFYSPSETLPEQLRIPQGWPQHAILCTDDRARMPAVELITPHMAVFEDPKMKELLITPKGVRLVWQIWQAERAEYLVLRQAKFSGTEMDAAPVKHLLNAAIGISATLNAGAAQAQAA
jgi:hypothetical protein